MHLETRVLVTGGPDSSDPIFVSDCSSTAPASSALTIFSRERGTTSAPCSTTLASS